MSGWTGALIVSFARGQRAEGKAAELGKECRKAGKIRHPKCTGLSTLKDTRQ